MSADRTIRLGVNTVLFQGFDLPVAMEEIAAAGYDGVEISAIRGMCEHLDLDRWREQAAGIRDLASRYGLDLLAMEEAALDEARLEKAFEAAAEIGVPVVNVGPGGRKDDEEDFARQTELLARMSRRAHERGITLCVKAHVGQSIHDTPTTLAAMAAIAAPGFGIDMDPSHIHRAGEDPAEALPRVLTRVRHIHIRDCKGRGPGPGSASDQACGRGDIDLLGYCRAMIDFGYAGPVCLEIIGAGECSLNRRIGIAAESYGYLNACLESLGARRPSPEETGS